MESWKNLDLNDLNGEVWKEISGYNGDYFVSNLGRVKSFKKWNGTDVRILKQHKDGGGYFKIGLYDNERKHKKIHTYYLKISIIIN